MFLKNPKIKYNEREEILSICFSKKKSVDSDIQGNVVIDYDDRGEIVNVDIMHIDLDNVVPVRKLKKFSIEKV